MKLYKTKIYTVNVRKTVTLKNKSKHKHVFRIYIDCFCIYID